MEVSAQRAVLYPANTSHHEPMHTVRSCLLQLLHHVDREGAAQLVACACTQLPVVCSRLGGLAASACTPLPLGVGEASVGTCCGGLAAKEGGLLCNVVVVAEGPAQGAKWGDYGQAGRPRRRAQRCCSL